MIARAALCLTIVAGGTACYRSVPLTVEQPLRGQRIGAALRDGAEVRTLIGTSVVRVEGDVAWARPDSMQLLLRRVEERSGAVVEWRGEPVTFARADLGALSERRLDRKRSWLLAGASAALAALIGILIDSGVIGGDSDDSPPIPPA